METPPRWFEGDTYIDELRRLGSDWTPPRLDWISAVEDQLSAVADELNQLAASGVAESDTPILNCKLNWLANGQVWWRKRQQRKGGKKKRR